MILATIVLDTCSVLRNLPFVKSIYDKAPSHNTEILVPKMVFQELDGIKQANGLTKLGFDARKAIGWIHDILIKDDSDFPTLRGQSIYETTDPELKKDASIIECAVYNARNTGRLTLILSNDKNMCNMCVVEGLDSLYAPPAGTPNMEEILNKVFTYIDRKTKGIMDFEVPDLPTVTTVNAPPVDVPINAPVNAPVNAPPPTAYTPVNTSTVNAPVNAPVDDISDVEMHDLSMEMEDADIMPDPIIGRSFQTEVMASVFQLVDWYIKMAYSEEELAYIKYTPPSTSKTLVRVYDKLSSVFIGIITKRDFETFKGIVKSGNKGPEFVDIYKKLLLALSQNSPKYVDYLRERKLL